MNLMYRGVAYNQSAAVAISSPAMVTGKYRGAVMSIAHPASAPVSQYCYNLKYRGVPYRATSNVVVQGGLASAF